MYNGRNYRNASQACQAWIRDRAWRLRNVVHTTHNMGWGAWSSTDTARIERFNQWSQNARLQKRYYRMALPVFQKMLQDNG